MFSSFTGENDLFNGLRINERCMKGGGYRTFPEINNLVSQLNPFLIGVFGGGLLRMGGYGYVSWT